MTEKKDARLQSPPPAQNVKEEWAIEAEKSSSIDKASRDAKQNFSRIVFDETHQLFDPRIPGFNRTFSYIGNVVIEGDIPSNASISVYGGAAVIRAGKIGHHVKIMTFSVTNEEYDDKIDLWRDYVASIGIAEQNLSDPVQGITYSHNNRGEDSLSETEQHEPIQIKPLDIYIESGEFPDRSDIKTAFDGEVDGLCLTLLSAGSVMFNGNTPPHTLISADQDCYIGGTTGAVSLLNIGGKKGVRSTCLGSINTATVFADVIVGRALDDCAISANGKVSIRFGLGKRSVITSTGDVTLPGEFLEKLTQEEKDEILRRITTSGQVKTTEGKLISDNPIKQIGYEEPKTSITPAGQLNDRKLG